MCEGEGKKTEAIATILDLLEGEDIKHADVVFLYEVIPYIKNLKEHLQYKCWKIIGQTMNCIEEEIKDLDELEKQGYYVV